MEKCGKVLRQERQSAARREVRREAYSKTVAGETLRCALAAPARGITKIRTVRRGRRTMQKIRNATTRRARQRKSFLPRNEIDGKGGEDAENSEKGTTADRSAEAARRALRRDAERAPVRNVADAGRTFKIDALPAGEHFRATAAFAEAGIRRLCGREAAACGGTGLAWRRFRDRMGIPAQTRHSQEVRRCAIARRWKETLVAAGGLLNRACGTAAEER